MASANVEVVLIGARLSYPHLYKPTTYKNDPKATPKYQSTFLFDLSTEEGKANHRKVQAAVLEVKEATFGPDKTKWPKIKDDHNAFLKAPEDENREEYKGHSFLKSKNTRKPTVLDRRKQPHPEDDGTVYGGCYVNAIVRIYAQTGDNLGLRCSVETVQYNRKGDAFGPPPVDNSVLPDMGDDPDDALGGGSAGDAGDDMDDI